MLSDHQAVVDPEDQRLFDTGGSETNLQGDLQEFPVFRSNGRVRHGQGHPGGSHEHQASGSFEAKELPQMVHHFLLTPFLIDRFLTVF
jgi:hypothetical protein